MYHVSAQGVDERMINVHYYNYYLLAGCYQAVWGFAVRKKSRWSGAKWVKGHWVNLAHKILSKNV